LPAILAIVAAGAGYRAVSAWLELDSAIEGPGTATAHEPNSGVTAEEIALSLPPIEEFRVIVERPLFSPMRRPPQPAPPEPEVAVVEEAAVEPAAQPAPPPPPPISFSLVGIVIIGDQRVALVQPLDGGKAVQLREGDEFSGWTAALIDSERAVFRSAYAEEELTLDFRFAAQPGSAPVPAEP
jgi:hypothetical protein